MILSCEFDSGLSVVSTIQLDFFSASENFKLKRIEGHDLFVVSCGRSFAILKSSQFRLVLVMKYLQITVMDIADFDFKDSTLWIKESDSDKLFTVAFDGENKSLAEEFPGSPAQVRRVFED